MNFSNFRPNFENNNYSNQNNFNCPPSNFQDCLCKCCTCVCVQCCCECLCECHRQRSNNNCNNNFNFINQKFRRRNIKKLQPSKSQDCYNNFSGMSRVDLDEFNKELTALKNKIMNQKNNFCNERLNYFSNPPLSNNSNYALSYCHCPQRKGAAERCRHSRLLRRSLPPRPGPGWEYN